MILYLMRHGETDWNKKHLFQGRTDIPLNEKGREVAKWASKGLANIKIDVAFCSPLCRARETAELVLTGRNIPLISDERIIEMGFGAYEATDMRFPDENIKVFFEHPERYRDTEKGVEPFESVVARTEQFLKELEENPKLQNSTVLIVTHGATIRGLLCAFERKPLADFWEGGVHKNCGVSILEVKNGKRTVLQEAITLYEEKNLK